MPYQMGNCMSWMKKRGGPTRKVTLAILGLDNAGKTVTAKGLQGEPLDTVAPTVGFSSIDFKFDKYDITLFDLGGGKRIRDIWKNYFSEVYGIIYVVDSSEPDRIEEGKQVLEDLIEHPNISGKPLLVLANKQDKNGALDEIDLCDGLRLEEMVNRYKCPCRVEMCSAIMGQGKKLDPSINKGVHWLLGSITTSWEKLNQRVLQDVADLREKEAKEKRERAERVRKIREERDKKEKEERALRGETSDHESDNEEIIANGTDPFKRINYTDLQKKEAQLKEEKRKRKEEKNKKLNGGDKYAAADSPFRSSHVKKGGQESEDSDEGFPKLRSQPRQFDRTGRSTAYDSDDDRLVTQSALRLSIKRSEEFHNPQPDSDPYRYASDGDTAPVRGRLGSDPGLFSDPLFKTKNTNFNHNRYAMSDDDEGSEALRVQNLRRSPWLKRKSQGPGSPNFSSTSPHLPRKPLAGVGNNENDGEVPRPRYSLMPLGPLEPLDGSSIDSGRKRKKKKVPTATLR